MDKGIQSIMQSGIQTKLKKIGDSGCFFLSIMKAFQKDGNFIIPFYDEFVNNGWMREDCYILQPMKIMEFFAGNTNFTYVVNYKKPNYEDYEWVIEEWYNKRTGYTHFRLKDWDPMKSSVTVKEGYIRSWRCFKW